MSPDIESQSTSAMSDSVQAKNLCARRSRPKQQRLSSAPGASPAGRATGTPSAGASTSITSTSAAAAARAASSALTTLRKTSSRRGCSRQKSSTPNFPSSPSATSRSNAPKTSPTRPSARATISSAACERDESAGVAPGTKDAARATAAAESSAPRNARRQPAPNFAFRCKGVPSAFSWPAAMMATRVQSASASSMECVVNTTARPTIARRRTVQRRRRDTGSKPADGSSSNTTDGDPTSAHATHSFLFMPPDKRAANRSGTCPSSTSSRNAATTSFRAAAVDATFAVRRSRNRSRCSAHDNRSYSVSVCVTTPRWRAAPRKSSRTDAPLTVASPALGNAARMTTAMADVLPAPFAPRIATRSRRRRSNETPSNRSSSP
mmetsp:Transcript_13884/g.41664  ORF Transcript_13884/g.41664 Transcript_13884/m.41664 type:complete len:379 (+) Transcript_13884:281-1417(+)